MVEETREVTFVDTEGDESTLRLNDSSLEWWCDGQCYEDCLRNLVWKAVGPQVRARTDGRCTRGLPPPRLASLVNINRGIGHGCCRGWRPSSRHRTRL